MVDADCLTRHLIDPAAAYALLGIHLLGVADDTTTTMMDKADLFGESSGVVHPGALVTLLEATGAAALLAVCRSEAEASGLVRTLLSATVDFRLPARGRLTGVCTLDDQVREAVGRVAAGECERARVATLTEVRDGTGVVVGGGTLRWNLQRRTAA